MNGFPSSGGQLCLIPNFCELVYKDLTAPVMYAVAEHAY